MKKKHWLMVAVVCVGAIVALDAWYAYGTADSVIITVTKTERVVSGSGDRISTKYLVFTEAETYKNTDSLWYLKWDSSDIQGKLISGQEYQVKVYGWRIPFMSVYRNIVELEGMQ